jgi:hypothetical protein
MRSARAKRTGQKMALHILWRIHILVRREMPLLRSHFVHQQTTRESVSKKKHGYTPVEKPAVR